MSVCPVSTRSLGFMFPSPESESQPDSVENSQNHFARNYGFNCAFLAKTSGLFDAELQSFHRAGEYFTGDFLLCPLCPVPIVLVRFMSTALSKAADC
jgi:hypothetical protein